MKLKYLVSSQLSNSFVKTQCFLDPCLTKNCGLYGVCRDNQGTGICHCADGDHLDGSPCQGKIEDYILNTRLEVYYLDPCVNKNCGPGVCTRRANASYEAVCSCPVNRQGDACEIPRGKDWSIVSKENWNKLFLIDPCREAPRCGGGYCKPNYATSRGYSCVCEGGVVKPDPCPFSQSKIFLILLITPFTYSISF